MASSVTLELVDRVAGAVSGVVADARRLPHLAYADARVTVTESRTAVAENGASRHSGADDALALGVRVLAGDRMVAPGYVGLVLGAADVPRLERVVREAIERAHRRAVANGAGKAAARDALGPLGAALADTRLHPVAVRQERVPATFRLDPRTVDLDDMVRYATDVSRQVGAADARVSYNAVTTLTRVTRELFASSEGALVDQAFALSEGSCFVVATAGTVSQALHDTVGHQRGWEVLLEGVEDPPLRFPAFGSFAVELAREAAVLADAPPCPGTDREVVVVTDPHYSALVAHEIVGHPGELDRALKMETAYAGRSWLLGGLDDHRVGERIASPLVTAYSDPALPGYGHYAYDDEGTPAARVVHIDRGVVRGFMNSRQTAAVFGGAPNGHWTATSAALVPLVRMSTTVFAPGDRDPGAILAEVDAGYYVAGHRIPSIAESRENFRISARRVYEVRNGQLGRMYRDGGLLADTRDYLTHVDAVGADLRLAAIPNCGKGQPLQARRLGNGGPTMRSRARVVGG